MSQRLFGAASLVGPMLLGLFSGAVFGAAFAAAGYASLRGRRDFASTTQLVASRYDVPAPVGALRCLVAHRLRSVGRCQC